MNCNNINNFIYKSEYQYPYAIMLNLTDNCNLACKYCFVEQHPHNMSLQVAKDAIDYGYNNIQILKKLNLKDNFHNTTQLPINFFGGEPMLRYEEIIKPIIIWAEEKYPNFLRWGITTNCTLLSKESIDFFKDHKVGILTSIDGAEQTQCYNRPCRNGDNSFKLIKKNIPYLLEQFPNSIFRSTIYAPTVQHFYENYLFVEKLGFKNYAPILDERYPWTQEQLSELREQILKIQFYRLQQRSLGTQPLLNCFSLNLNSINLFDLDCKTNLLNNHDDGLLRCGLGTCGCAVGWDGKIYGCQQDVSLDDKNIFYIGDIYNGIDIKRHSVLLEKYYNEIIKDTSDLPEKCQRCYLKDTCYGVNSICPSTNLSVFGNTHKVSEAKCLWVKTVFQTASLEEDIVMRLDNYREELFNKYNKTQTITNEEKEEETK